MRSYSVTAFSGPIEMMERETPKPQGTEALVKVSQCGVCHSDVHIWHGGYDLGDGQRMNMADRGVGLPLTLGHEIYGEIVAVGPDGDASQIGTSGVVYPWIGCGSCAVCAAGNENMCAKPRSLGVFTSGGYGDHVIVPRADCVVPMPGVEPAVACTYACSGLTAFTALRKARPYGDGAPLVVIGAGGLGLTAVALLVAEGTTNFTVVDIDDTKLEAAREMGAPTTVNSRDRDAAVKALIADGPVAAVVDFVGSEATAAVALPVLRKGGAYIVVGLYGGSLKMPIVSLPLRALRIEGSYVGNLAGLQELATLVGGGRVKPIPVERRPWSACAHTLEALERGDITGRVVLDVG